MTQNIFSSKIAAMNDWKHIAQLLRAEMAQERPPLKIEKVMQIFSLNSTSTAEYYLLRLEELGEVVRVRTGDTKSEWFLVQ